MGLGRSGLFSVLAGHPCWMGSFDICGNNVLCFWDSFHAQLSLVTVWLGGSWEDCKRVQTQHCHVPWVVDLVKLIYTDFICAASAAMRKSCI
jgi:hypothetical protein